MPERDQVTRVRIRFASFEADLQTQELKKNGLRLRLPGQSFQILRMLLERPGELVSREELHRALWPSDSFVDFEHGVNAAVNRLREALGDSAEKPSYVETLPRRGYRLIVPVAVDAPPSLDQPATELPSRRQRVAAKPRQFILALAALGLVLGAISIGVVNKRTLSAPRILRFRKLTNDGQTKWWSTMVSDGSRIYFTEILPDRRTLILQVPITGGEAVPLRVSVEQPVLLDLSRDGTELLVANLEENEILPIWLQPVTGGSARRVGTTVALDARFAADGTSIIYTDKNGHDVYSVNLDGSAPRKLFTVSGVPNSYQFSPDGRRLRFTVFDAILDKMTIMEATRGGTGLREVVPGAWGKWTPDSRYFVFQTRQAGSFHLWALPEKKWFSLQKNIQKPVQLTAGPIDFFQPLPSNDGKQIFAVGKSSQAEVIRYDLRTKQFAPYLSGISAEGLAFSKDGQWVTFTSYPDGTLWRCKADGTERLQLTFPPLRVLLPRWSPDGKEIVFSAVVPDTGAEWGIYLISSKGGTPQRLLPSSDGQTDANWFPDGNSVLFSTFHVTNSAIYTLDLRTKSVATLPGSSGLFSPRISPDGRYVVALTSARPFKLMLFDVKTGKWAGVSGSEYGYPSWSPDGEYVYFREGVEPGHPPRILRLRVSDRRVEHVLDEKNVGRMTIGTLVPWLGIAPDGSPLLARDISTQEIYALDVDFL
jgi:Tol biopolymer transport system component/DNA-binding winged helix-turn-helix (wHTH) protein